VTPQELLATIYHCLGIEADTHIHDLQNRPYALVEGAPVRAILS
jgi:hypothetical protein